MWKNDKMFGKKEPIRQNNLNLAYEATTCLK